ncbi:MAG: hypothetical protein EON54_16020 [Alcaligenaceae bacterium]|nr:MAG: hypothetical protein EON54_16020 [Alcaligenaceae bacterium]
MENLERRGIGEHALRDTASTERGGDPDTDCRDDQGGTGPSTVELDLQRYKRRAKRVLGRKPQPRSSREELIRLHRMWAPFGGIPQEVAFIQYGLSKRDLYERIRIILSEIES